MAAGKPNSNQRLCFVHEKDCPADQLLRAEAAARAEGIPYETADERLLTNALDDAVVYVLGSFGTVIYERLREEGKRVVGPLCVLACIRNKWSLPEAQENPVFCLAMKGVHACCTNLGNRHDRGQLHNLIVLMGGVVLKSFTASVTHLVAGEVGSAKYNVAHNLAKPILLPGWVEAAWEESRKDLVDATTEDFMRRYRCPAFQGCCLCVTGLDVTQRKEVKTMAEQYGGVYSGELSMDVTTHLIASRPAGEKYAHARQWGIPCVTLQWFYDSVETKGCADISKYEVEPGSTEVSSEKKAGSALGNSRQTAPMSAPDCTKARVGTKRARSSAVESGKAEPPAKRPVLSSRKDSSNVVPEEFTAMSSDLAVTSSFLDGCKIVLIGFAGEKLDLLRKIINKGGGIRFSQVNETVSHVVVDSPTDSLRSLISTAQFSPHVVTSYWLLESCQAGQRLPEGTYACPGMPSSSKPTVGEHVESDTQKKNDVPKKQSEKIADEKNDILGQYLNPAAAGRPHGSLVDCVKIASVQKPSSAPHHPMLEDDIGDGDVESRVESLGGILSKLSFALELRDEVLCSVVSGKIEEHGGSVVDQTIASHVVVPLSGGGLCRDKQVLVTVFWLEQCLSEQKVLPVTNDVLFQPVALSAHSTVLSGCVVCLSQYDGVLRQQLASLATAMGALVQDYFVRSTAKDQSLRASTHLLCQQPAGSKYQAALRWNLPVVNHMWLIDCAQQNCCLPAENYVIHSSMTGMATGRPSVGQKLCPVTNTSALTPAKKSELLQLPLNTTPCGVPHIAAGAPPSSTHTPATATNYHTAQDSHLTGRAFQPMFDTADAFQAVQSPAVSAGVTKESRRSTGIPLEDMFQHHLASALERTAHPAPTNPPQVDVATPALPSAAEQTTANARSHPGPATADNVSSPACKGHPPENNRADLLKGVRIFVHPKKLNQQRSPLHLIVSSLGGAFSWRQDNSCTHLVFEGKASDASKEVKVARASGQFVVSPHWLYACDRENTRVDERLYPHTFNPKRSLSGVSLHNGGQPVSPVRPSAPMTPRRSKRLSRSVVSHTSPPVQPVISPVKESKAVSDDPSRSDVSIDEAAAALLDQLEGNKACEKTTTLIKTMETGDDQAKLSAPEPVPAVPIGTLESRQAFEREMEDLLAIGRRAGTRRSSRRSTRASAASSGSPKLECSSIIDMKLRSSSGSTNGSGHRAGLRSFHDDTDIDGLHSELSQSDTVTYDDPTGAMHRDKIISILKQQPNEDSGGENGLNYDSLLHGDDSATVLKMATPFRLSTSNDMAENTSSKCEKDRSKSEAGEHDLRSRTPTPPPPAPFLSPKHPPAKAPASLVISEEMFLSQPRTRNAHPKFHLTSLSPREKADYMVLIEKLGGKVYDTQFFHSSSTHIVVGQPSRSEKYLAAVASGKWNLRTSFLVASQEAGHFVNEEDHEWGCPLLNQAPPPPIAAAARRWRLELRDRRLALEMSGGSSRTSVGAFESWRVLLSVQRAKQPGLKRLLEAGGAKIVKGGPPFNNITNATHAFITPSSTTQGEVDLPALKAAGIQCLKVDYIADFLLVHPSPPIDNYVLSVEHLARSSKS